MKLACEYCGWQGEYRVEVQERDVRRYVGPGEREFVTVLACVDTVACDARWAKANPEEVDER